MGILTASLALRPSARLSRLLLLVLLGPALAHAGAPGDDPTRSVPEHPYAGLSGKAFWQAAERDRRSPTELPGASGSFQFPSPHGPFRSDLGQKAPKHAHSPFDRDEVNCPSGGCDYLPDVLLVRLKPDVSVSHKSGDAPDFSHQDLNEGFADLPVRAVSRVFPRATPPKAGATVVRPDGLTVPLPDLTRWHRIELDLPAAGKGAPMDLQATLRKLRTLDGLDYVEPDYQYRTFGKHDADADAALPGAQADKATAAGRFSDPDIHRQWHLDAAKVADAWQYLADRSLPAGGSADIIVAVIDTGVDYSHPDLAGSVWVNQAEFLGSPGVDEDGNGFVDDIHGANVIVGAPSADPQDDHGHGTHVAGIIAAQGSNGAGGVGVAPNVRIMAIKAAQYSGALNASDIARGIVYAVDNGADIINMSFGGYARSQVVEDALANAFGFAVLVAAAGNDGRVNLTCPFGANMYPAAYNWVLGVMSRNQFPAANGDHLSGFSNFDCSGGDLSEYELMAPGAGIYSTLPAGGYGAWSGTSMATPVVAGMAALLRTRWSDKAVYSSRFIMGQLAATGPMLQAYTPPRSTPVSYRSADALQAISTVPQPALSYLEHWLFDTTAVNAANNPNGIVDAGETVELGIVIRNQWGKADNVQVTLAAWAPGAVQADPWVEMLIDTVDYGAVGSFNQQSNGFQLDDDGVPIGVLAPFRFRTLANTPNDHLIVFRLTITASNGYDATAPGVTQVSYFRQLVQSGTELPRLIEVDMSLDDSRLWLVPDGVLVKQGATLSIGPGARLQFFSADPNDPFAEAYKPILQIEGRLEVAGSAEAPVDFFTGLLYPAHPVVIRPVGAGDVRIDHARMVNPVIGGESFYDQSSYNRVPARSISNTRFSQNVVDCIQQYVYWEVPGYWIGCGHIGPSVNAQEIVATEFNEMGYWYSHTSLQLRSSAVRESLLNNVFAAGLFNDFSDTVFLRNYRRTYPWDPESVQNSSINPLLWVEKDVFLRAAFPVEYNGYTYAAVAGMPNSHLHPQNRQFLIDRFARSLGGNLAWIDSQAENDFVGGYIQTHFNEQSFRAAYADMDCGAIDCWTRFSLGYLVLGAVRASASLPFQWIGGQSMIFQNWGQSPDASEEWCAYFRGAAWYPYCAGESAAFLIKIPGRVSQAELDQARSNFMEAGLYGNMANNAFLNVWNDLNPEHWLRFVMTGGSHTIASLAGNYWGTNSSTLIDAAILDFKDNFNFGVVNYQPILTTAPASAYPFVVDVAVANAGGVTSQVGAEPISFTVRFNRDMDTSRDPMVSFGPAEPYTDFVIAGGWTGPRTWVGQFNVTPVTGDGWQYVRVVGAAAADKPWLLTGNDYGRFRFEVATSGTEAMNLQASGEEGQIRLWWSQDDFDTLAGYNLYRSRAGESAFERVNSAIVPQGMSSWEDSTVEPGQPYEYYFTVVQTDLGESEPSNIAIATALDTIAPVIVHTPVSSAVAGQPLTLRADVTDNVAVQSVTLFFRARGAASWQSRTMALSSGVRYAATLEGTLMQSPGIDYYVEASDGGNTTRSTSPAAPHQVLIDDRPVVTAISPTSGPAAGGTQVTITGSNFQTDVSASVGAGVCVNLVRDSSTSLRCTTTAQIPDLVDVRVSNPTGDPGILTRAFNFLSDTVSVALPEVVVGMNQSVQIPLAAANVAGMVSASFTVDFDPAVIRATGASLGNLTPGWSLEANTSQSGRLSISMASGGGSVSGSGSLAVLAFDVVGAAEATTALSLGSLQLNGGAIASAAQDGRVTIDAVHVISGSVRYWNEARAVPGTRLTLGGDQSLVAESAQDGSFSLGAPTGAYQLTPSRQVAEGGISAFDASLVLRHQVETAALAGQALVAADVNRSGEVNAHDAYLILQKVVGASDLPFSNAGKVWLFAPESLDYPALSSSQTNQNFEAVLLGDPSGNWSGSATDLKLSGGAKAASFSLSSGSTGQGQELSVELSMGSRDAAIYSIEAVLAYDPQVFSAVAVDGAQLPSGWTMASNLVEPGRVRIALAGSQSLSQTGKLLGLKFLAVGTQGQSSSLSVQRFELDEGAVDGTLADTQISIEQVVDIFEDGFEPRTSGAGR